MKALDETKQGRVDEIAAMLRRPGGVSAAERRELDYELTELVGIGPKRPIPLDPARQARVDQIQTRLMDHALGKPGAFLGDERYELQDELYGLLNSADEGGAAT